MCQSYRVMAYTERALNCGLLVLRTARGSLHSYVWHDRQWGGGTSDPDTLIRKEPKLQPASAGDILKNINNHRSSVTRATSSVSMD